ncbi:hypothetical protein SAMN06295910_2807 [Allosphingosinicella indica]|uniref:Uncharacterized protein n=1 Tax=Allosphingosinicella indica TaxID=941907 RepID=A0A1X7H3E7_9SPHN|nr:hypothetical protein SAMN06295910_2807 [Allosphingosinicella indica]
MSPGSPYRKNPRKSPENALGTELDKERVTAGVQAEASAEVRETTMFDYANLKSVALALIGALALSTVTVGAAVGPAATGPVAGVIA